MSLTVIEAGLHSLVVDAGRPGSRHLGLPLGGAADRAALALGNALLGNAPDAPALELTMAGPTLVADDSTACVIFGAPFLAAIANHARVEAGVTFTLQAGQTLKIGGTPTGVRAYLCVTGGFTPPRVRDSASAFAPIQIGEQLPCRPSVCRGRGLPFVTLPTDDPPRLRILPGPQWDWFLNPDALTTGEYVVNMNSNRMGLRLNGPMLERRPGELVSEAVAPGAMQITNEGQPIILGVDGQTIGGYPKVAHLILADLDRLAQLRPGMPIGFTLVTPAEASALRIARETHLREWLTRLAVAPLL